MTEKLKFGKIFLVSGEGVANFQGEASFFQMELKFVRPYLPLKFHPIKQEEKWFYFSRLFMPHVLRGRGLSHDLLKQMEVWADEEKVNILCEINPYGPLKLRDLYKLYAAHGFVKVQSALMIRRPHAN